MNDPPGTAWLRSAVEEAERLLAAGDYEAVLALRDVHMPASGGPAYESWCASLSDADRRLVLRFSSAILRALEGLDAIDALLEGLGGEA